MNAGLPISWRCINLFGDGVRDGSTRANNANTGKERILGGEV
jgi:hypothetical protein